MNINVRRVSLPAVCMLLLLVVPVHHAPAARVRGDGPLPAGVIAEADRDPVTSGEFLEWLEQGEVQLAGLTPIEREGMVKQFVVDRILAREARVRRLDESDLARSNAESFDRKVLPDLYYRKEFQEKAVLEERDFDPLFRGVTDSADVSVAVLSDMEEARVLLEAAERGESFDLLVRKYSLGNSAGTGGILREIRPGDLRFTTEEMEVIFSAPPGRVAGPFSNKIGAYSVIKVLERKTAEEQKEALRKDRGEELRLEKARKAYNSRIDEAMKKTEIEINEDFFAGGKRLSDGTHVAWIKGTYIYPKDLGVDVSRKSHGLAEYRRNLDRLLRSIVTVDLAKKAGIADLPEYMGKKAAFHVSQLAALYVDSEVRKAKPTASKTEIQEYYRSWYLPEVYSVWVVVNTDRGKVEAAREEILAGGKASEIAKKYSDDLSAMKGGTIGYLPIVAYDPESGKRIRNLKNSEVSEVFAMGGKHAVLRLLDRKEVPVPKLEDVREDVKKKVILQKRAKVVVELRAKTLERASLNIDSEKIAEMK